MNENAFAEMSFQQVGVVIDRVNELLVGRLAHVPLAVHLIYGDETAIYRRKNKKLCKKMQKSYRRI